jgi:hypothetical protein
MFAQILAETPKWVFVVFFVLLGYGYFLAKTRSMNSARVAMLPSIMIVLSVGGVLSSFGAHPVPLIAWVIGFAAAIGLNQAIRAPRGVTYDPATSRFIVPGSWTPLALMMAIYFAKYTVGATTALHPEVVASAGFEAVLSTLFGLLSGTFFARFLCIRAARENNPAIGKSEATQDWKPAA